MNGTEIVPYLSGAAVVMYVQRWMKQHEYYQRFVAAFPGADKWAHRLIALTGALIVALGIGYSFDWTPANGGDIIVHIPKLELLKHGLWDWFNVYVLQQGWYDATKDKAPAVVFKDPPLIQQRIP